MLVVTGAVAGMAFGYVLMRSNLCFHSAFRGLYEGRALLARAWILGVAIASVGLSVVYAAGPWDGLNRGLAFRPLGNIGGGLVFGIGMVVAASCVSGLFYKLGSGMLGAGVGLAAWAMGELVASRLEIPGPTLLSFGEGATVPGLLGVPRLAVALPAALLVLALLFRSRGPLGGEAGSWGWPAAGLALGAATIGAWVLAGVGGASFGPSTVGAIASAASGRPHWWLTAFLVGLIPGATIAAKSAGGWAVRGEEPVRYAQLAAGGFIMGAGAYAAGGCNLGHAVSGLAQLNVSSFVVVASMIAGVGLARAVTGRLKGMSADWRPVKTKVG